MSTRSSLAPPAPDAWQSHGDATASPRDRLTWIDTIRGAALVGMVTYHGAWDLHAFGITEIDPGTDAGWRMFGGSVAGLFLALSGVGLSLAARQGGSWLAAVFRLGRIAAAAVLVSAATRATVPEAAIWFGILHCIVLTNLVALTLWRAPDAVLLVIAGVAWLAPLVLRGQVGEGWAWTGLADAEPATLDFRPLLPWLAPVLIGVVFGRSALIRRPSRGKANPLASRPLALAGRHSLLIYLVHQPVMLGIVALVAGGLPWRQLDIASLRQPSQAAGFLQHCGEACVRRGGEPELCASTCHCALTEALRRDRSWPWLTQRPAETLKGAVALCRPDPSS